MAFPVASAKYPGGTGPAANPAYSGIFIPTIWSSKLIEKFYNATVLAAISNTDYEGEISKYGDKVVIRQTPSVTIRDYEADAELQVERPSAGIVELLIDKGKYFNCVLDDVMRTQSDLNMLDMWSDDASEQLKITIDTTVLASIYANISALNKGATAGKISGNINLGAAAAPLSVVGRRAGSGQIDVIDLIIRLGLVLDEQNVPETGRWLVIPAWMRAMIKSSDLRDASLSGDGESIVRNGRVGMIDRFTVYSSNLLPTAVETGDDPHYIFAGHKNGLTFASQLSELETMRSERTFGTILRGLQVYGHKVTDPLMIASAYARSGGFIGTGT
jgi:hypothetical protein